MSKNSFSVFIIIVLITVFCSCSYYKSSSYIHEPSSLIPFIINSSDNESDKSAVVSTDEIDSERQFSSDSFLTSEDGEYSLSDAISSNDNSKDAYYKQFRITTLNIGHFSNGESYCPNGVYSDFSEYKNRFDSIDSDFFAINENSPFFDQYNMVDSMKLYSSYSYYLCGTIYGYTCNAFLSNYPILEAKEKLFDNSDNRYYIDSIVDFYGTSIHFVVTHLDWFDKEKRNVQISELLELIKNYDYFVLCGDMNPSTAIGGVGAENPFAQYLIDYQRYKNVGYNLANVGTFGEFNTLVEYEGIHIYPWDNIITSSKIEIVYVEKNNVVLSDHFPLTATLRICFK